MNFIKAFGSKSVDRESRISRLAGSRVELTGLVAGIALVIIVAAIALTAKQIEFERRQATQALIRDNQARVFSFEQFVLRTLEAADLATQQLAASVDGEGRDISAGEMPKIEQSPLFEGIAVQRPSARFVTSLPDNIRAHLKKSLDLAVERQTSSLIVTAPFAISTDRQLLGVVRVLETGNGMGYAAVLLDPRRFTDFATNVPFQDHDLVSLIGLDGITRARRTGNVFSSGEDVRNTLVMRRQFANPDGTYLGPSVLDGVQRYFSHRRLERYQLFATSGMSTSLIDRAVSFRRNLLLATLAAVVVLVLGAATAVLLGAERRRRQLREILAANVKLNEAQRIGGMGDWDYFPEEDLLHWSENLRIMYGRGEDEQVSKMADIEQYIDPADAERVHAEIEKILRSGETRIYELNVVLPDGSKSIRRVVAAPVRNKAGAIIGIHGTDQDITRDAQLRDAQAKLHELARMDSMNALTATLAHELNQPLGVASNYLSAAARHAREEGALPKVRELILDALKQIMHLAHMVSAARDLVSHSSSHLTHVSTDDVFEMVVPLLRSTPAGQTAKIGVDISADRRSVFCNSAQLKQVLFNLGKNGLEAAEPGMVPHLQFRVRPIEGGKTRFDVEDNGRGIELNDPFAAMASTKDAGLGLGLSLARTIIEAHEGRIWIGKTGPDGTTISFEIPGDDVEGLVPSRSEH